MASANLASERGYTVEDVGKLADNLAAVTDEEAIQFFRELVPSTFRSPATPDPSELTDALDGLINRYGPCSRRQQIGLAQTHRQASARCRGT